MLNPNPLQIFDVSNQQVGELEINCKLSGRKLRNLLFPPYRNSSWSLKLLWVSVPNDKDMSSALYCNYISISVFSRYYQYFDLTYVDIFTESIKLSLLKGGSLWKYNHWALGVNISFHITLEYKSASAILTSRQGILHKCIVSVNRRKL